MTNKNKTEQTQEKKTLIYRFLKWVEDTGNKLPHPFTLFVGLVAIVMVLSFILAKIGIQVKHPVKDEMVIAKSLFSREGIQYILYNLLKNFAGFKPLGLVLTMMIGIGLAEQTGLMSAFMRKFILGAPEKLLIMAVFFIGICGNIASDAAVIIVPPLAGAIFYAAKKNPIVGVAAGYAAACAGFTANVIIAGTDVLLAGITEEAAHIINPEIAVSPLANYYFMFISTFILAVVGTWITKKITEKQAGKYVPEDGVIEDTEQFELSIEENKGLRSAGIATLIYWGIIIITLIPQNSVLRGENGSIIKSPFIKGIVPFLLFWFIITGISYGRKTGVIKCESDIPKLMTKAMQGMAGYIVLVFVIAQFVSFFNWTNIGLILAVTLGDLLKAANFTGFPMVICVILISMFINLFIGSGSAKWALLSPVFVPMFMMLGYSPEFAQLAYRIGDSTTNAITPLFPYFAIYLGFMQKYKKDVGIGTCMSMMLPYTIGFGLIWIVMVGVWFFLKVPLGPGVQIFM